jgi:hypothetical protein
MHILEHNVTTGEISEIPLTDKEVKELEKKQAVLLKEQTAIDEAREKSEADKAALLTRLGLTEDELKTILG